MDYERKAAFAGSIVYQPRTALSPEKMAGLGRLLVEAGLLQEPENPVIVIDWYLEARDSGGLAGQRYVVLYRDGGDSEPPACVLYRKDVDRRENRVTEFFHIPPGPDQPRLADAWKWLNDPSGQQLQLLTGYLDSALAQADLWHPLPG